MEVGCVFQAGNVFVSLTLIDMIIPLAFEIFRPAKWLLLICFETAAIEIVGLGRLAIEVSGE